MHAQLPITPSRRTIFYLSVLPLLTLLGCSDAPPPTVRETIRPAYVAEARLGSAASLSFVGEVRASRRAELGFAVAGRVSSVAVEVGDTVRRGQVLATLDLLPLSAQYAAAKQALAKAEAQLYEAKQRHERISRAQAAAAVSTAEVSASQAELLAAEATQRAAVAQRDAANWSLEQATLRAPMDGMVATRLLEPGQVSGAGNPVMTIDGEGRELSMLVPASLSLKPGTTVSLRSGGAVQASQVLRVAGRLEAGGVRRVFLTVPDVATVGSIWAAALDGAAPKSSLQVPLRAVLPAATAGNGKVLRLARDGRTVESVELQLGELHGSRIEVTQGLAAGDRVIVAGATGILPGSLVRPIPYKDDVANAEVKP